MTERDLSVFFIPPRLFWVDAIKNGEFPLWNPYYYSGIPLLATLQPAVFYPLNILLLILPFDLAFNWLIILHFFLAGIFTFLLLRELGASIVGALIGALIFMLGGYLISVHNLLSTLLSVIWVPFIIFLYLRVIKRDSLTYAVFTGIALAIMFTGGGIEVVYGTLGFLLFLALLPETFLSLSYENTPHPYPLPQGEREYREVPSPLKGEGYSGGGEREPKVISPPLTGGDEGEGDRFSESEGSSKNCASVKKRITFLFLSVIIFLLLSAVQLLPFLELSHYSVRADGLSYIEATTWSMDLKDLVQFFIPDPYGYGTSEAKYWSNQSWLKTIYLGTIPFILSFFFFLEKGRRTLPFILFLIFSLTLAFGKNSAIYEYLYYYLPSFNKIRYPVKFLFLVFILLSISAGLGWDSLKQNLEQGRKSVKWIIIGLLFFATLAAIAFGWLSYFDKEVKESLIAKGMKLPEYNDVSINLFNTKRLLVIFMMSVLSLYGGFRSVKARKALPYLIVFILTIDLFFAHSGYYYAAKAEEYHQSSESIDFILKDKDGPFRIFVTPKTKKGDVLVSSTKNKTQNKSVPPPYSGKEIIQGYNLERQIFDIDGMEVVRLSDYEKVSAFLTTASGPAATNLLALLNVKYVLSIPEIKSKEFKLVKVIQAGSDKNRKKYGMDKLLKIYQNFNYLPMAFLVERYKVLAKEEEYKKIMQSKKFRPGEEVLLYEEPWGDDSSELRVRSSELVKTKTIKEQKKREDEVSIVDYRNNSVRLSVNTDRPKILVLSETYYTGWKVFVDGQEKKILKANFVFRAVPLSAGKHKVEFIYDPWTFKIGLYITLATIISLITLGILNSVRTPRL
ncbi:MAG: hypothetical protein A3G39_08375 [Deltaproteobacteria bacterium RIFCSPLOWO2_12_FULL_43_16]|nr:MAG: hypothetical protein A2Z89_10780 [Deltaproteobacteria bacterium GWA2_43_19]OGQ12204.1 MAG: hypothetical protein A3D30_01655 [Deltaproteobacteria bacterium RIFCSPHIGHO2_02_FULL_43_33]OGQ57499.1 MAG: hypothetical protein A3G39_08375 [Deltaproteobacteria bacterium RIFCSPLOWO2_12_FULL_43_16]HBR17856.1 hypothetical protein [Deltaproteobacteria bacterium]